MGAESGRSARKVHNDALFTAAMNKPDIMKPGTFQHWANHELARVGSSTEGVVAMPSGGEPEPLTAHPSIEKRLDRIIFLLERINDNLDILRMRKTKR